MSRGAGEPGAGEWMARAGRRVACLSRHPLSSPDPPVLSSSPTNAGNAVTARTVLMIYTPQATAFVHVRPGPVNTGISGGGIRTHQAVVLNTVETALSEEFSALQPSRAADAVCEGVCVCERVLVCEHVCLCVSVCVGV